MKTDNSLLENTRRFRKTRNGVITNLYSKILERSRIKKFSIYYSLDDFKSWVNRHPYFESIFIYWEKSNFKKEFRPSIDRIDVFKEYSFDNMEIVPFYINRIKGEKEKLILWGVPIIQIDIESNEEVSRFKSIKEAVDKTGLNQSLISAVLKGVRKHTGGYKFIYSNPNLLN